MANPILNSIEYELKNAKLWEEYLKQCREASLNGEVGDGERFSIGSYLISQHNKKVFQNTSVETKQVIAGGLADYLDGKAEKELREAKDEDGNPKFTEEEIARRMEEMKPLDAKAAQHLVVDNPGHAANKPMELIPEKDRIKTVRKVLSKAPTSLSPEERQKREAMKKSREEFFRNLEEGSKEKEGTP